MPGLGSCRWLACSCMAGMRLLEPGLLLKSLRNQRRVRTAVSVHWPAISTSSPCAPALCAQRPLSPPAWPPVLLLASQQSVLGLQDSAGMAELYSPGRGAAGLALLWALCTGHTAQTCNSLSKTSLQGLTFCLCTASYRSLSLRSASVSLPILSGSPLAAKS